MSLNLDELAAINDELAALVRAGVPLEPGLARLGSEMPGRLGRRARALAERLQGGEALEDVLDDPRMGFPRMYTAILRAGQRSGRLAPALELFAETQAPSILQAVWRPRTLPRNPGYGLHLSRRRQDDRPFTAQPGVDGRRIGGRHSNWHWTTMWPASLYPAVTISRNAPSGCAAVRCQASTTIGFPHGGHTTTIKQAEAEQALAAGCQELDMVVNISKVLSGDWDYITVRHPGRHRRGARRRPESQGDLRELLPARRAQNPALPNLLRP